MSKSASQQGSPQGAPQTGDPTGADPATPGDHEAATSPGVADHSPGGFAANGEASVFGGQQPYKLTPIDINHLEEFFAEKAEQTVVADSPATQQRKLAEQEALRLSRLRDDFGLALPDLYTLSEVLADPDATLVDKMKAMAAVDVDVLKRVLAELPTALYDRLSSAQRRFSEAKDREAAAHRSYYTAKAGVAPVGQFESFYQPHRQVSKYAPRLLHGRQTGKEDL